MNLSFALNSHTHERTRTGRYVVKQSETLRSALCHNLCHTLTCTLNTKQHAASISNMIHASQNIPLGKASHGGGGGGRKCMPAREREWGPTSIFSYFQEPSPHPSPHPLPPPQKKLRKTCTQQQKTRSNRRDINMHLLQNERVRINACHIEYTVEHREK